MGAVTPIRSGLAPGSASQRIDEAALAAVGGVAQPDVGSPGLRVRPVSQPRVGCEEHQPQSGEDTNEQKAMGR